MASRSGRMTELQMPPRKSKVIETSPERTKVWTEPPNKIKSSHQRVAVIYYLSRNGQLEHPHFIEVPLSNPVGLYLRDVISRLNFLRGNGIASMYSWSCKRSYKNGYVWHDLCEDDFIYPAQGREYILKGSEIVEGASTGKCDETVRSAASFNKPPADCDKKDNDDNFPEVAVSRRRHQSWSSDDFHEYRVFTGENSGGAAANASTQTEEKRRRRRPPVEEIEEIEEEEVKMKEASGNNSNEICTDEISPPPSDSSSETLENLMKSHGRIILRSETIKDDPTLNMKQISGRSRASTVLMQLLSCGSIGFRDCAAGDRMGKGISNQRMPRGRKADHGLKESEDDTVSSLSSGLGGRLKAEDKEYFSGSLIETKKEQFPALKRSSSYTANSHR